MKGSGNIQVPKVVWERRPGSMVVVPYDSIITMWVREDEWGLRRYSRRFPVQVQMGAWDIDGILLIVMLARFGDQNSTTFEYWVDACTMEGLAILQHLVPQHHIDLFIVTDRIVRSFRVRNPWRIIASDLIREIRGRRTWTGNDYSRTQAGLSKLFPTPDSLWRRIQEPDMAFA